VVNAIIIIIIITVIDFNVIILIKTVEKRIKTITKINKKILYYLNYDDDDYYYWYWYYYCYYY
jgi:hypothetical protein